MALLLQLRTRTTKNSFTNPSLIHLFSTSNSNSNSNDDEPDSTASDDRASTNSHSHFSSYFNDVKNVLKQRQSTSPSSTLRNPSTPSFTAPASVPQSPSKAASFEEIRKNLSEVRRRYSDPNSTPASGSVPQGPSKAAVSFEEIRKNLSEFRRRYSDPNSTPSSSSPPSNPISFQELYKRNVTGKLDESPPNADSGPGKLGGKLSLDAIRESVRNRARSIESSGSDRKGVDPLSLSAFTASLRLKPSDSTGSGTSSGVIGGTGTLPASIFGKEMREKEEGEISEDMKMELVKIYKHEELGDRLRKLRPDAKGGDWFSLRELNERLIKLREIEEKEPRDVKGLGYGDLKGVLLQVKINEDKRKKSSLQRLDILGELGRTPSFMLQPPKEHLVEKYFHPDNMSLAEKMKIELAKVRDEFKMSESDCGSFRVQVAQLTTKIKHLSSVLHKKDKHSRKGLLAMVQKRKRLLKYLRRTDWDSYCFVISKLGLRDNPDTKY